MNLTILAVCYWFTVLAEPPVVMLWHMRASGGQTQSSGVLIDESEKLVLACHHPTQQEGRLLVAFPKLTAKGIETNPNKYLPDIQAKLVWQAPRSDLAVFQLDRLPRGQRAARLGGPLARDAPLTLIGNPTVKNIAFDSLQGRLVREEDLIWTTATESVVIRGLVVRTQPAAEDGFSGGAMFNEQGQLVGCILAITQDHERLTLGAGLSEIKRAWANSVAELSLNGDLARSQRATTIDPSSPRVWTIHGHNLARHGQIDAARMAYRQAQRLEPLYWPAWLSEACLR